MDFQQLISYIHQLEIQNKELQKHIYNIQQQLDEKNESIILVVRKKDELAEHIKKCENEIIKRQERELSLLHTIQALSKDIEIYVEQINRVRKEMTDLKEKQRQRQKDENDLEVKSSGFKSMRLPPKSNQKCRNCELLGNERQMIARSLDKERERCNSLQRDIQCIIGTFKGE